MKTLDKDQYALTELYHNICDLYTRVSTQEQAEEGFSLAEQERKLRSYADAMGYKVNAVHSDPGISGSTLDRPGIQAVIDDVKAHKCGKVIVWKLDRLSRSQKDTLTLLEDVFAANGCAFVSLSENFDTATPIGKCIVGVLAAFAQMERENIKLRTMMGKQAAKKKGHFNGGRPPLGYLVADDKTLHPNPETAHVIQEAYEAIASGESLYSRAHILSTKYGLLGGYQKYHGITMKKILLNPIYCGRSSYGDSVEPLVSVELWEQVHARIEANKEIFRRQYERVGLLTGLIWCGRCGSRLGAKSWGKLNRQVYVCRSRIEKNTAKAKNANCKNPVIERAVLDEAVLDQIRQLKLSPDVPEESNIDADTAPYETRLKDLDRKQARLMDLYESGGIELDEIKGRLADIRRQKEEVQAALSALKKPVKAMTRAEAVQMSELIDEADEEQRREVILALIEKIVVDGENVQIHWAF